MMSSHPLVAISAAVLAVGAVYGVFVMCQSRQGFKRLDKVSKQGRRQMWRLKRRERKDERLRAKKLERSRVLAVESDEMTEERKNEQRERIRMQRVERYQKLEEGQVNGVRVVVDLAFAADQTDRERNSILKQLGCVYGYLRSCPLDNLLSLHLASCTPEIADVCAKHGAFSWKIGRHEKPVEQLFLETERIYLSPDSDTVLETLDPTCVYVVGGIADRSVRKGETMSKASAHSIRTARLPLQENFQLSGTRVRTHIMNLDPVIIALNEVANHGSWARAFQRAVPPRISRCKDSKMTHRQTNEVLPTEGALQKTK